VAAHRPAHAQLRRALRRDEPAGQRLAAQPARELVWRPSEATTVSAGYARYFTPPPSELLTNPALARYVGTTLAPEVLQASPPRPERAHYFNLGIRHRIGESLTLGGEAFYRSVRDMQDLGQFGSAYIFSPTITARAASSARSFRRNGAEGRCWPTAT